MTEKQRGRPPTTETGPTNKTPTRTASTSASSIPARGTELPAAGNESVFGAMVRVYARSGWKVFPVWWIESGICACRKRADCKSAGKHPLFAPAHPADSPERATCRGECGKVGHGLYDAIADLETLSKWWARYPKAHIGLPADGNGLAVLDVDPRHGGEESFRRLADYMAGKGVDLTATLTQETGSGGKHYIYAAPEGGVKGGADVFGPDMAGLDVRGRGHYIVAAPSGHETGGTYRWLDFAAEIAPWHPILTRLAEPVRVARQVHQGPLRKPTDRYAAAALEREVSAVAGAANGTRNNQLNTSAYNLGTLVGAGLIDEPTVRVELYRAALASGLGESESVATILSGLGKGKLQPRAVPA